MAKKKPKHGGKREGAGRKARIRSKSGAAFVTVPISLPEDIADLLDHLAGKNGRSRSQEALNLFSIASPPIRKLLDF